jgi:hypothetical protein
MEFRTHALLAVAVAFLCSSDSLKFNYRSRYSSVRSPASRVYSSIFDKFVEKLNPKSADFIDEKSEKQELVDLLEEKPWRAAKVKTLKLVYRPWKESYLERYRSEDDETIYLYTIKEDRMGFERTRPDDLWDFPFFWTKTKTERMGWIYKQFTEDVNAVTVQEHMELDAFFAEYDMVFRWGSLRIKEADAINAIILNLIYFTDFNGIKVSFTNVSIYSRFIDVVN